jgi:3-methylcrotonyl-CoA carboxylase alpha subunit
VASGEKLPKRQDELSITGHAIEARLYAEDPARGFLPSVGRLDYLYLPQPPHFDGVRVDTGVEEGDEISSFYDPMIAKLVAHSDERVAALDMLGDACGAVGCSPVKTNAWFLQRLCEDVDFRNGEISTAFIEERWDRLTAPPSPSPLLLQEVAEHFIGAGWSDADNYHHRTLRFDRGLTGFRLNGPPRFVVTGYANGQRISVDFDISLYDGGTNWEPSAGSIKDADEATFFEDGAAFDFAIVSRGTVVGHGVHDGEIVAPMPGRVTAVEVKKGDKVAKGQRLLTLEAMKMEHALTAPFDGTVAELNAKAGAQVSEGQLLVKVEPLGSPAKAGAQTSA